jgi:two-component system, NarL family, nitrate/nitrite response regulator NarL
MALAIRCGLLSQKDRARGGLLPDLARRFAPSHCVQVISLLLVEHPPLIRRALVARLLLESDLCVLAEADHASEAVRHAEALHPDVVLLDAQMPNLDVSTIVRRLRDRSPSSRIVLLSLDAVMLAGAFDGDAPLIVGKHEGIGALLAAIRRAPARVPHVQ